jgi:hypothetical protein
MAPSKNCHLLPRVANGVPEFCLPAFSRPVMHSLNGPRSAFGVRRATDINLSLAYFRSYFCTLQKVYQKSGDLSSVRNKIDF